MKPVALPNSIFPMANVHRLSVLGCAFPLGRFDFQSLFVVSGHNFDELFLFIFPVVQDFARPGGACL